MAEDGARRSCNDHCGSCDSCRHARIIWNRAGGSRHVRTQREEDKNTGEYNILSDERSRAAHQSKAIVTVLAKAVTAVATISRHHCLVRTVTGVTGVQRQHRARDTWCSCWGEHRRQWCADGECRGFEGGSDEQPQDGGHRQRRREAEKSAS